MKSLKNIHKYLCEQSFLLRVDHTSLQLLYQFKNLEVQIAEWLKDGCNNCRSTTLEDTIGQKESMEVQIHYVNCLVIQI